MRPPLEVNTTLKLEELERLYREAKTPLEKQHAQIILLLFEKMPVKNVAHIVRVDRTTVTNCVRRFNQLGPESLKDARAHNRGRAPLLDDEGKAKFFERIKTPPDDGGIWTSPKASRWIEQYLDLEPNSLHRAQGWKLLQEANYSYKSTRPSHVHAASEQERQEWKKKSRGARREAQRGEPGEQD
jgi:transposase